MAGSDATPEQPGGDHFSSIWGHIEQAYQASLQPNVNPIVTQRVQYFRRAMGLVGVLIKVYRPILDVWRMIAHRVDPLAADPLDWAQMPVGTMMVPAWTIGGVAESRIPLAQRQLLGERLASADVSWVRANGFRSDVREPIHQYLAGSSLNIEGLGRELGLGLSRVPYVAGGRIELDASAPGAMRHAFYLRYVRQYVEWWNRDAVREQFRVESARADEGKAGLGVTWFLSAKKLIAAMMIMGSRPGADGMIRPFNATGVNLFLRDA